MPELDTRVALFVCVRNAGRSQMAEAFFNRAAPEGWVARSAGSEPAQSLHVETVWALAEVGIDVSGVRPKGITPDVLGGVEVVVSMGCGDGCPAVAGARTIEWDVEDPAGRGPVEVRAIRDDIARRVGGLIAVLASREMDEHPHVIDTGKGQFDLDDLGPLLPGMAEIMPLVGGRIWKCYYAGRARNKPLARFQLKEAVNLMQKGAFLRPKYAENMDKFVGTEVEAVSRAIEREDWESFETAFKQMVDQANAYHDLYEKPFLRWKMPDEPPPDLDLTPRR